MNPLIIAASLLFGLFSLSGGSKRRKSKKAPKSVKYRSAGKAGPKKRTNSAGKYVDGRGKPYTPANAPNWLRAIWAKRKRNRKTKK